MEQKTAHNTTQLIIKEMTVGEILQKVNGAGEIMSSYGLSCVGCSSNLSESLEQGTVGHGMAPETLNSILDDLNSLAQKNKDKQQHSHSDSMEKTIHLTETAAKKILSLMEQTGKKGYGLRFGALPGGCSGLSYQLDFEENPKADDVVITEQGVKVFVNPASMEKVGGSNIDFVDGLQGSGFKIENPRAHGGCGCGKSFS